MRLWRAHTYTCNVYVNLNRERTVHASCENSTRCDQKYICIYIHTRTRYSSRRGMYPRTSFVASAALENSPVSQIDIADRKFDGVSDRRWSCVAPRWLCVAFAEVCDTCRRFPRRTLRPMQTCRKDPRMIFG